MKNSYFLGNNIIELLCNMYFPCESSYENNIKYPLYIRLTLFQSILSQIRMLIYDMYMNILAPLTYESMQPM